MKAIPGPHESERVKVVIIEDNRFMRESWNTVLNFESDMKVLAAYSSCEDALDQRTLDDADIILLDIGLPGMSGIEGVKAIKKRNPGVGIIMATVYEDDGHIFDSLSNGAVGYLQKKASATDLVQAIRAAYNGGSPMSPVIARRVIESFQERSKTSREPSLLSDRERQVLQLLAEGYTYAAIGRKMFLSVDGVGYYIRSIYQKLQVKNRGEAVREGLRKRLIRLFR